MGIAFLDLLESYFSLEFLIEGDKHLAQATFGVEPEGL